MTGPQSAIDFLPRAPGPVILGGGLAGLSVALALAPAPSLVIAPCTLGEGAASAWAQGGVAAAVGPDDTVDLHIADTLAAGAGLNDPAAVRRVIADGPAIIARFESWGVRFDQHADGDLKLGLEAAHGRRRIVHAEGDGTGAAIMRAAIATAKRTDSIQCTIGYEALRLLCDDGGICGVLLRHRVSGTLALLPADRVVLATGGVGALWRHTTNPLFAQGQGLAMAGRVGARLMDLEFAQFHPTAIDVGIDPMPLASEALRGEGGLLLNDRGTRFMADIPGQELAPRDVVARAVDAEIKAGHRVYLDTTQAIGADFAVRFPTIAAHCRRAGINPATDPIPVRPALHYHMGGVKVDEAGRTTVAGLWACGEVAATGLHGANRLASNSLLEAAAEGIRTACDLAGTTARPIGAMRAAPRPAQTPAALMTLVRDTLSQALGVLRDETGLRTALDRLTPYAADHDPALVGALIAASALKRRESRGAHARTDYPTLRPAVHSLVTAADLETLSTGTPPTVDHLTV